jgi:signal transduction histidine kinase/CheY-like chemotaxis protein
MPLAALLPLVATLLGLWAGGVALGFRKAPGWEPFRAAAWPAFSAAVYCAFDVLATYPATSVHAPRFQAMQIVASGAFIASLGWYLPAVSGPHPLDRVVKVIGIAVVAGGALAFVPGLAFASATTARPIEWLNSTYTEAYATPFGDMLFAAGWIGLGVPIARTFADMRRGHPTGRLHLVGIALLALTAIIDLVTVLTHARMPYLLSLGFILTVVYGGRAIFARFASHAAELAVRSRSLAELIDERTKELAHTEEQLHRAEKLAALGQLAAGVAHEVNNPSAAVVANLSYVLDTRAREGAFPPDSVSALQESLTAMGRVTRIVRQLLDAGRAGAKHEVLEAVALPGAVESALAIVRPLVPATVTLRAAIGPELSVRGREDLLVQALVNLITNAVQAVPEGKAGRVTITATSKGRRILLVVEDDGDGMSEEVRARIFEPFFTTKAPGVGTGLGLSVTLGIIRSLGGQVTIDSEPGKGTRVTVDLRADRATDTSRILVRTPSVAPTTRIHVLVVDDEREVREALRRVLKRKYEIRLAGGVEEALEELHARPDVDIVLCDVLMPDGGGELVWRRLEESSPELARRVIFMTGGAQDATRAFLESQPQPVLEKPLEVPALTATIEKLLGLAASASEAKPDVLSPRP